MAAAGVFASQLVARRDHIRRVASSSGLLVTGSSDSSCECFYHLQGVRKVARLIRSSSYLAGSDALSEASQKT